MFALIHLEMISVGTVYRCIQSNQRRILIMMYHFLRFLLIYIVLPKDYGVIYLVSPILHCSSLLSNPCQKSSFIFKNLGLIIKTCTDYAQFFIKHYPIYIHIRAATLWLCFDHPTITSWRKWCGTKAFCGLRCLVNN